MRHVLRSLAPLPARVLLAAAVAVAMTGSGACKVDKPTSRTFYDQHVQPIFNNFCVGNTSPCHRIDRETGTALGNLDLSSFDSVQKRRDVLRRYGSYPLPLLLLKAVPEDKVLIPYQGEQYPSQIRHAGGKTLAPNSDAFYELRRWLDNGANKDGLAPAPVARRGQGECNPAVPAGARPAVDRGSQAYADFLATVQPMLVSSCAFSTCHSAPQSDLYLTCGDTAEQRDFNFVQAAAFVVPAPTSVAQSELLLRPLDPTAGGVSHTGGVFFNARTDPGWMAWEAWAEEVRKLNLFASTAPSAGQDFFQRNVMPKLLQRGCAVEGCHSPNGFNDYRLRPGAQGFFSPFALERNYLGTLKEFMAIDSVDVRQSRVVKKAIFPTSGGTAHRGGPVLEDAGNVADACPAVIDPATSSAFCILKEWHRIERMDHAGEVSPMAAADVLPLAFVARPPNPDSLLAFDTYRGGADLKLADAVLGEDGAIASVRNVRSALSGCGALAGADVDVRGPEWSYDGSKLIFAARQGMAGGLDLWLLDVAGGSCRQLTSDNGRMQGLVRVHNFDPVFAPDGSVVYASTRSGTLTLKTSLPNADLFRVGSALDFSQPEQMTWLLNSELAPAFMQNGQVTFTAEKATPGFYQLAGRRINWDLTDYHPLLAQRARSTDTFTDVATPSVGYQQATEIREALDRNFLLILSDEDAAGGGGALATFNRSVGPFEEGRGEVTFLPSLVIVDPTVTGRAGTQGVYRSPFSLPNGEILASYASNVANPKYDLVAVSEAGGARRPLASDPTLSYVEAALGYKRAGRELFRNLPQLVFGGQGGQSSADEAVVHFPDLPLLATLLNANLRRGRNVEGVDKAVALRVYQEVPPPSPMPGTLFTQRTLLGQASLEADRSLKVALPARRPLIFELVDGGGNAVFTMGEEHQLGPGEYITPGAPRALYNGICAGCHGSISGQELDIAVTADALTGASVSASRDSAPKPLR
jgi:hypothetical protein